VIKDMWKAQREGHKEQEEDHGTVQDTYQAVKDVRQIHQDTHQVVKEMWTTQQEVHQKQEEDHRTLQDTQQAVEDVRHIHQDTHQAVEEVVKAQKKTLKAVQEVNEKFENLKERTDESKGDEILRKLAEVNSQKVIEDHVEQYQEGTRAVFFESVEKWLDDRSSPNRVMVISGNAGMGKSVIAAVICKRLQKAGRLSGSHFCQHDKARYRNPKVMLQSLACQLSSSLPEYKDALVKTLSRNLGAQQHGSQGPL